MFLSLSFFYSPLFFFFSLSPFFLSPFFSIFFLLFFLSFFSSLFLFSFSYFYPPLFLYPSFFSLQPPFLSLSPLSTRTINSTMDSSSVSVVVLLLFWTWLVLMQIFLSVNANPVVLHPWCFMSCSWSGKKVLLEMSCNPSVWRRSTLQKRYQWVTFESRTLYKWKYHSFIDPKNEF